MREIKFRAWDKANDRIFKPSSINFYEKLVGYIDIYQCPEHNPEADEEFLSFDEVELMQYTGFKDSEGREIYEGDIIEFVALDFSIENNEVFEVHDKGEVVFEYGKFIAGDDCLEYLREVKVIGNIYENSELIGGEDD